MPTTRLARQLIHANCNCREGRNAKTCVLTHVELPDETGHVAVLEVKRQQILGKLNLVQYDETAATLLWLQYFSFVFHLHSSSAK